MWGGSSKVPNMTFEMNGNWLKDNTQQKRQSHIFVSWAWSHTRTRKCCVCVTWKACEVSALFTLSVAYKGIALHSLHVITWSSMWCAWVLSVLWLCVSHFVPFRLFLLSLLLLLLTGIHTYTDLRAAQRHAWRGVKHAVDRRGTRSSPTTWNERTDLLHARAYGGSATSLAMTACSRKAKVAHCARVAGGSDGKTSSLAVAKRST